MSTLIESTPGSPASHPAAPESETVCERLPWDSEFFGLPIARVVRRQLDRQTGAQIEAWCRQQQIDCLYFLADASDTASVRAAEAHGFRLVDIRLTMSRQLEMSGARQTPGHLLVAPATAADVPALRAIAHLSHGATRFYADPNFDRDKCDSLYATWIEKSCAGYADAVLVAKLRGQVAGYFSCHRLNDKQGKIGLVGVDAAARGQHIGSSLLEAGLRWFWEQGVRQIEVVTQGSNLPAQRLYQKAGFLTEQVQLWYHRWFRLPAAAKEIT